MAWLPDLQAGWVAEIPVAKIPLSFGYPQLNPLLLFGIVIFIALALLVSLAILLVTRRLMRPIRRLVETVQRFAEGKWEQRARVDRNDEIGQLARSFNSMADELSGLYASLETKIKEGTDKVRTAAEVSQVGISSSNLDELLRRTTELVVDRFRVEHAAIFLIDPRAATGGEPYVFLRQATGPSDILNKDLSRRRLAVNSLTLVGWVTAFNQPRIDRITDLNSPSTWREDLLPETRVEAGIPIAAGSQVLGMLNVQSFRPEGLAEENVSELQTIANQIAPAIHNFHLLETAQIDLQEVSLLYQASHQIAQAETPDQILGAAAGLLQNIPYYPVILVPSNRGQHEGLEIFSTAAPSRAKAAQLPKWLPVPLSAIEALFPATVPTIYPDPNQTRDLPQPLVDLLQQVPFETAAFFPIGRPGAYNGLLILGPGQKGARAKNIFTDATLRPYSNLIELVTLSLEKAEALMNMRKQVDERQTLDLISQAISVETDLDNLYQVLHKQISHLMGDVGFLIALYDAKTNLISIPYMSEGENLLTVPPFPLGDGPTSVLIRTGEPLLLTEDVENKMRAMGAKQAGAPAKSWLGVPLLFRGEAMGAIVIQDTEQEYRFSKDHQRLLSSLASQVAVAIHNARLIQEASLYTEQLRFLQEITSAAASHIHLNELLEDVSSRILAGFQLLHCGVVLFDANRKTGTLVTDASAAPDAPGAGIIGTKLPMEGNEVTQEVIQTQKTLVLYDVQNSPRTTAIHELMKIRGTQTLLIVPLISRGEVIGTIGMDVADELRRFGEEDLQLLDQISLQIASAIDVAQMFDQTIRRAGQERLQAEIIAKVRRATDVQNILQTAVLELTETLHASRGSIQLIHHDGDHNDE